MLTVHGSKSPPSLEESQEIARDYLIDSPTFKFDGMEEGVKLIDFEDLDEANSWAFDYEFECINAGYGDRSGQSAAGVVTPHAARITVAGGEVTSAIIDQKWDMMEQKTIEPGVGRPIFIQLQYVP